MRDATGVHRIARALRPTQRYDVVVDGAVAGCVEREVKYWRAYPAPHLAAWPQRFPDQQFRAALQWLADLQRAYVNPPREIDLSQRRV